MNLHKLLQRQLNRLELSEDKTPDNLEQWQDFISKVNKVYIDNDEERYLIERSIELSSREINELNERIQNAQHIAGIGYWHYDSENDVFTFAEELKKILNFKPDDTVPNINGVLEMVHINDRERLGTLNQILIESGEKYETDVQMLPKNRTEYIWLHVIGAPYHCTTAPFKQLSGICMDITKRKQAEQQIEALNQEILNSARRVGMADVASTILHNVGNVLNSANVSIALLNENKEHSHFKRFLEICKMLETHASDADKYLVEDEKGKLIPGYLVKLSEIMAKSYETEARELENLTEKIQHIRDIVASQQSLSEAGKITELVSLDEVMDSALKMVGTQLSERDVNVTKQYEPTPKLKTDRAKLLQILVNFIQNAKDALIYDTDNSKHKLVQLIIKNATPDNPNIEISISDNGIGISDENVKKIFNYGFTTKKSGHGIGLHSSLLAAKELGANIQIYSDGVGHGATCTLQIPTEGEHDDHST